jgi:hypothetical protein
MAFKERIPAESSSTEPQARSSTGHLTKSLQNHLGIISTNLLYYNVKE